MGKVRPERVKRIARELMERFPDKFTADFKANKESVKTLIKTSSPKLRNIIAGYITRMINIEQAAEGVEVEEEEAMAEEEAESIEIKDTESETSPSPPPDETPPEKKEESLTASLITHFSICLIPKEMENMV